MGPDGCRALCLVTRCFSRCWDRSCTLPSACIAALVCGQVPTHAWHTTQHTPAPPATPMPPQVTHPMDLATVLANVNARVYATPQQYLADIGRIVQVGGWAGRGHGSCSRAEGRDAGCMQLLNKASATTRLADSLALPSCPSLITVLSGVLGHRSSWSARDQPCLCSGGRGGQRAGQGGAPGAAGGAGWRPRKCRAGALGFALHCLCMTVAHVQAVMVDCLPGTAVNSGLCASFSLACRPSWRRLCPGEGPRHPLPVSCWLDDITLRCTCTTCAAHPHPTHNCSDCCLPAPVHSHATPMPLSSQLPLPLRLACAARRGTSRRADAGRAPHVTPPCWPATERRCGGPARHTARSRNGSD